VAAIVTAIGLLVIVALLLIGELFRDRSASFEVWRRWDVPCPSPETKGTRRFEVEVINIGLSPDRAACSWGSGRFTTAVLDEYETVTRIIVADVTRGMDVDCRLQERDPEDG
jgi:hypothetical protein